MCDSVLILGAGMGGLSAAKVFDEYLQTHTESNLSVTVLGDLHGDRFPLSAVHEVVFIGDGKVDDLSWKYSDTVLQKVPLVDCIISSIDTANKRVEVVVKEAKEPTTYTYDRLVVATGAAYDFDKVKGLQGEGIWSMGSLADCQAMRVALTSIESGTVGVVAVSPYKCPPAPFGISIGISDLLKKRGVKDNVDVFVASMNQTPPPGPDPTAFVSLLEDANVQFVGGFVPTEFDTATNTVKGQRTDTEGKTSAHELKFDHLLVMPPIRGADVVRECKGLATSAGGFITGVDFYSHKTATDSVYGMGDCCNMVVPFPKPGPKPHPKAGAFASGQGVAIAHDILFDVEHPESFAQAWDQTKVNVPHTYEVNCVSEFADGVSVAVHVTLFGEDRKVAANPKKAFQATRRENTQGAKKQWIDDWTSQHFNNK